MGRLALRAAAVPRRASATCTPMAKAISWPVNHLVMVFEMVIPVISQPTPKMAKPKQATAADMGRWKEPRLNTAPWKSVETATYLMSTPTTMSAVLSTPVKRIPSLSRMMPPKKSIRRNTLMRP